jgi:hypothetical protein
MESRKALVATLSVLALALLATGAGGAEFSRSTLQVSLGSHLLIVSDRDGDEDVYGASADGRRLAALTRNRVIDDEVVTSPDGRWFAVERGHGQAVLVSADGRRERALGSGTMPRTFSPDGRLLVITHYSDADVMTMFLVPVGAGRRLALGRGFPLSFSPNGRALSRLRRSGFVATRSATPGAPAVRGSRSGSSAWPAAALS